MYIILAAAAAAAVSWAGNKVLIRIWKAEGIIFLTPLLEETAKTVGAIVFNQSIVLVHLVFGGVEAVYDMALAKKNGPPAALASLFGHLFYGIITTIGLKKVGIVGGVLMAYLVHTLWNAFIIKRFTGKGAVK